MKKMFLWCTLALWLGAGACSAAPGTGLEVRPPAVAGTFYPADSSELAGMLAQLLAHSRPAAPRVKPLAVVCPHAGYVYSGLVAAAAYRQLEGFKYSTVVVVSPSHQEYFEFSSVLCRGAYSTPLGVVPVDTALADRLVAAGAPSVHCGREGHYNSGQMGEHSLEVQLPFLQTVLGKFHLVPVVMGSQRPEHCKALGDALAKAVGNRKDVLLVASSDLSHFHTDQQARSIDSRTADCVARFDPAGLLRELTSGEAEACGGGPIAAVMQAAAALGADRSQVLMSANSGDATGDLKRVVGYLAARLYSQADTMSSQTDKTKTSGEKMGLDDKEKKYLLDLAHKTVAYCVAGGEKPECKAITPVLGEKRGAFVTLKKHGELRGCIGYIIAVKPLVETVREMAEAAALHDPRFSPVTKSELPDLDYEISVLSPIRPLTDPDEVQVGRDGLIVRRGAYQGLLLPQVPVEFGWDRLTFLAQTCRKAGLPPEAWKQPGTQLEIFSAEVFGDSDFPEKQ